MAGLPKKVIENAQQIKLVIQEYNNSNRTVCEPRFNIIYYILYIIYYILQLTIKFFKIHFFMCKTGENF
jgi:hypothetical protein